MRHPGSLRVNLVAWLVTPVVVLLAADVWLAHRSAAQQANLLYDRQLLADTRMIGEQIEYLDGAVRTATPPSAFTLFPADASDDVVYAVIGPEGRLIAGLGGIAPPPAIPADYGDVTYDSSYRDEALRAAAFTQPVLTPDGKVSVMVVVGQTLVARNALTRALWLRGFLSQAALALIAGLAIWIGVTRQLLPLLRLRNAVRARPAADLSPFDADAVQTEIRPLVEALNGHMGRLGEVLARQRSFLDSAAHQIRTPLAVMKTQVSYARRTPDREEQNDALTKIDTNLTALARLANQLLALASIARDRVALRKHVIEFAGVARQCVADAAPRALDRGLNLSFEADADCWVTAREVLLREIVNNLIDNAIAYVGREATATISVRRNIDGVTLTVSDDGVGAVDEDPVRLMTRFARGRAAAPGGSGLGLAIVAEIAEMLGGAATIGSPERESGFCVHVTLPARSAPG